MPATSILAWLAIGLMVGAIGTLVASRRRVVGMVAGLLVGIAGALFAGFIGQTMQWTAAGTWQDAAASALGAVTTTVIRLAIARPRG